MESEPKLDRTPPLRSGPDDADVNARAASAVPLVATRAELGSVLRSPGGKAELASQCIVVRSTEASLGRAAPPLTVTRTATSPWAGGARCVPAHRADVMSKSVPARDVSVTDAPESLPVSEPSTLERALAMEEPAASAKEVCSTRWARRRRRDGSSVRATPRDSTGVRGGEIAELLDAHAPINHLSIAVPMLPDNRRAER